MVMTPGFHPGDPGSIPLVGDFYLILIFIHIFNLVPNSLSAAYYNFQHTVDLTDKNLIFGWKTWKYL